MDLQISGKRALVSGSTKGIGFAIACELAREGARVVVNGRQPQAVGEAVERLRGLVAGAEVAGVAADLSNPAGIAILTAAVPQVDILVNNLGIFDPAPFAEIPDSEWQRFFDTNVMSGVRLARHYLPGMTAANWGRIVFISSESGINTPGEMVHYGMTKSAQLAVSRGLAQSCAGTGVTVNAVLPGPTRSEGVGEFFAKLAAEQGIPLEEMERRFFAEGRPTSILKRMIDPAEVAALVAYVCSTRAAATTGAALRVEGGIVSTIC
ncbi:SDR family NAD(P)-dependent oxidoreductase [Dechloromonas denitrificans]|uniref:SDR family NAD(P)-dependent oxidoreductase n=1 Tax=Dechloromonas denitrificans TaxID=281362 RepID=UPI001CF8EBDE|nr:SDR family oxidoreductase [Dechloromonas denitrificans]UCV02746.1 SDR family oxidoreductase [Dechloromonas denitrificans]